MTTFSLKQKSGIFKYRFFVLRRWGTGCIGQGFAIAKSIEDIEKLDDDAEQHLFFNHG